MHVIPVPFQISFPAHFGQVVLSVMMSLFCTIGDPKATRVAKIRLFLAARSYFFRFVESLRGFGTGILGSDGGFALRSIQEQRVQTYCWPSHFSLASRSGQARMSPVLPRALR